MSLWLLRAGIFAFLLTAGWAAARSIRGPASAPWGHRTARLRVLASIFPLYDFARQVGGDEIELRSLLPPGVDPHEFGLSPRDVAAVSGADIIFANGAGLDDFLLRALEKAGISSAKVVTLTEGLPLLRAEAPPGHGHAESVDPHAWLDPVLARAYVAKVGDALLTMTPSQPEGAQWRNRVETRLGQVLEKLSQLDGDYRRRLAPLRGRAFIAFHGAFRYLAARYGLRAAGVWQRTPGREPAPREVGAILALARREKVRALFSEPHFSPRALEMIAQDAGLPVHTLDPLETAVDFRQATYFTQMRRNLDTLVHALR